MHAQDRVHAIVVLRYRFGRVQCQDVLESTRHAVRHLEVLSDGPVRSSVGKRVLKHATVAVKKDMGHHGAPRYSNFELNEI